MGALRGLLRPPLPLRDCGLERSRKRRGGKVKEGGQGSGEASRQWKCSPRLHGLETGMRFLVSHFFLNAMHSEAGNEFEYSRLASLIIIVLKKICDE